MTSGEKIVILIDPDLRDLAQRALFKEGYGWPGNCKYRLRACRIRTLHLYATKGGEKLTLRYSTSGNGEADPGTALVRIFRDSKGAITYHETKDPVVFNSWIADHRLQFPN